MGESQVDIELAPVANGMGTATVHGEPAMLAVCSAACIQ
jgi:hypothetical protein